MTIGEFFGPALGAQGARQALETATARGSVAVWRVAAKEFRKLLLNQPVLGLRMVEALTRRQRRMERRLECVVFKRAEARLAETLRELSGAFELQRQLEDLFTTQNQSSRKDMTSIPATFLRVTVAL